MKKVAVDTNIAIAVLNDNKEIIEFLRAFDQIFIPITVSGELLFGVSNSKNADINLPKFREFISRCLPMYITDEVAECYASIRLSLKNRGKPIPENDIWIAAVCVSSNIPLLTKDKHFDNVEELKVLRV